MAPQYKVTYFNVKALAEPIRFLLSYAGVEFEDVRIEREDWPALKTDAPFGKMPLLEIDGKVVHQSVAIGRYLAKQFKLGGDNDWETLEVDIVIDTICDFRQVLSEYFRLQMSGGDPDVVAKKKESIHSETLPFYLPRLEEVVKKNDGYFVGGKLTYADIYWTCSADTISGFMEVDILKDYPLLQGVRDKVLAEPSIKAWVDKRPVTKF